MKKSSILMSIILVVSFVAMLSAYAVGQQYGRPAPHTNPNTSMNQPKGSFHVNKLIGKIVKNDKGQELGKVEDIIVQSDGAASFIILSRFGMLGIGAKYYPVPFKTFMSATDMAKVDSGKEVTSKIDTVKLDSGPCFNDKEAKEMAARGWQYKVCNHYGAQCHYM